MILNLVREGNQLVAGITGNTYEVKDEIKALGFKWQVHEAKTWSKVIVNDLSDKKNAPAFKADLQQILSSLGDIEVAIDGRKKMLSQFIR